jgi:hypothetical protein
MTNKVYIKQYQSPVINKREILRYAGVKSENGEYDAMLDELMRLVLPHLSYRVCYTVLPITHTSHMTVGGIDFSSAMLESHFSDASYALLFCATVGAEIDRQVSKLALRSPTAALLCNAIGTERVESLCDEFCRDVAIADASPHHRAPRYSAGYGDLSLEWQRTVFDILTPERHIGVALRESLLMSPSKSVTAFVPLHSPLAESI